MVDDDVFMNTLFLFYERELGKDRVNEIKESVNFSNEYN